MLVKLVEQVNRGNWKALKKRQVSQRLGEEMEKVEGEVVGREEKPRGMVQVGNTPKSMREHGKTQNEEWDCRGKGGN